MLSVVDMFKVGIGPSSSHTMGPMYAGRDFARRVLDGKLGGKAARVTVDVFGSLALTGEGHGTMGAILAGLEGCEPKTVDTALMRRRHQDLRNNGALLLGGRKDVPFNYTRDFRVHKDKVLAKHPNGMSFALYDGSGKMLLGDNYYSIGGGFIKTEGNFDEESLPRPAPPYPFANARELLQLCDEHHMTIAQLAMENEKQWQPEEKVREALLEIYTVMKSCVEQGCVNEGILSGGLGVVRRAPNLLRRTVAMQAMGHGSVMPWASVYAIAVAEENAAGSRIVTAPTNGAAGIIPAVLLLYKNFFPNASEQGVFDFLLTAGALGMLYKMNASIAGAEAGCQAEVGVACSMAAGAFCAVCGGTLMQVANATEIGMEHNLGLTCDPVGGLVQIPCIERNGLAAERAVTCAQLALMEDGAHHKVSLDEVIGTMYLTGKDMQAKYKETSLGGLAVTVGHASIG